ncbi:hypothetical protein L1987_33424 [Smallanthus sonchifolius]|uniref:Uncharacterized protein n=1 Tax=Smallanthus sonchifolius TaxID=185202 RepID=A0ACB9HSP8_9ASTR|nr:hypothetical protein L1987_33424 [Smallanthus sonchifolius]
MGSGEVLKAAKVYRELMKTVKKHIGKEEHKTHFRDFVKSEFRKNGDGLEPSVIQQKIKLASDYTYLLSSVHNHQDLLFTYNIAVDRSDEMKKVLGKSAASVGLQLPEGTKDDYGLEWFEAQVIFYRIKLLTSTMEYLHDFKWWLF